MKREVGDSDTDGREMGDRNMKKGMWVIDMDGLYCLYCILSKVIYRDNTHTQQNPYGLI
jgi:hypothetical protein